VLAIPCRNCGGQKDRLDAAAKACFRLGIADVPTQQRAMRDRNQGVTEIRA
jgi:hypothetical protein